MRHLWAGWRGEKADPETGYPHLWHASCCIAQRWRGRPSMKIYLAGSMSGLPEFNFPVFFAAAAKLRDEGHIVFNLPSAI